MKIISLDKVPKTYERFIKDNDITDKDLQEADGVLAWPMQLTSDTISKLTNLKVIQTFSAGVDNLNFDLIPENVKVFSNAGAYSKPVAELAWALALSLAKNVGKRYRTMSYTFYRKNVLVLGAGGIGSEIARIAKRAFGCRVIGVSRSFKKPTYFDEKLSTRDLEAALRSADAIFSSLPLTKLTRGLLNATNLNLVKEHAIIVNVGRAEIFEEEDLYEFLKKRPDVRFGTDVFWRHDGAEDFDSKLWTLENFTGTLHTAGAWENDEVIQEAKTTACKNIINYFKKGRANNEVRREDYI